MNSVRVTASREYDIHIGSGILEQLGTLTAAVKSPCRAAVITDSNVGPLYAQRVCASLEISGFTPIQFTFPAGEENKNTETYLRILNFLAQEQFTRSDLIIALGGGVTGDIAGFAAATFLRGIDFVQIPTSLLAMVDSSVGGKTAIDLPAGKNLVGAFYQPILVLCDISLLSTLPDTIFRDGCAEVIKYAVLYDQKLFQHLCSYGMDFDRAYVISRCIELKRDVVAMDEFDTGLRQKLNLGHTIGHGIEKQSSFCVSHGQAVAIGMSIIAKAASRFEICSDQTHKDIISCLKLFRLPVETSYSAECLYQAALSDKKRTGSKITLILPERIGACRCEKIGISQLLTYIKAGLS